MTADINREAWQTIVEALGVEQPGNELRHDIDNLHATAVQLVSARRDRETPRDRRAYQKRISKAAGRLRGLLEHAPPHAITELYDQGLHDTVTPNGQNPPPITQGINELVERVREIEVFADIVASTPHRRSEKQRAAIADLGVDVFLKHCPRGNRHDAHSFCEGIYLAACLTALGHPEDAENPLERHTREAWKRRTKPTE